MWLTPNTCHKNVYILYDIENVYSRGYDVLNEYEKNKSNIKYIHIRDYNKKTQEYVYFGEGTIPILELLEILNKDKYDGVISLETMLPKYNKKESKKDIFVKSYKSFMNIYNMEEWNESGILWCIKELDKRYKKKNYK